MLIASFALWWFYFPIYKTQSIVKKSLLDPDSAQFFDLKYYRTTNHACGFVNSKNKLGGYAGKQQFVASLDGAVVFAPSSEEPAYPTDRRKIMPRISLTLNDAYEELQESTQWQQERLEHSVTVAKIRYESAAFKLIVAEKCPEAIFN